jgi:uncharacterized oligopeptide transporter (OPT) family protein
MDKKQYTKDNRLQRWSNFQLPHAFKKIGLIMAIVSFAVLIVHKISGYEDGWVKPVFTNTMLVGMLFISLAREKLEDEYIISLRAQSYRLAFVIGVSYGIVVLPLVNYLADFFVGRDNPTFGVNYFEVIFYMLLVQLLFFSKLKRQSC